MDAQKKDKVEEKSRRKVYSKETKGRKKGLNKEEIRKKRIATQ